MPAAQAHSNAVEALRALYACYRGTERMWVVSYRDVDLVPALQEPMHAVGDYLKAYAEALLAPWPKRKRTKPLRAAATLAVQFASWRTLAAATLSDDAIARLMADWVRIAGDLS